MVQSTDIKAVSEKNISGYGLAPLHWEQALDRLKENWKDKRPIENPFHTHWLATVRPDGRPHVVPVGAAWHDGAFYFTSGKGTRKSRNLATNANCVITTAATGFDLVVEGTAKIIRDGSKLDELAQVYAEHGWAPTVRDGAFYHDYSAPSAGPPPWDVYEFTPHTVFGLATGEPGGATRWDVRRGT